MSKEKKKDKYDHCKDCEHQSSRKICKKCTSKNVLSKKSQYSYYDDDYTGTHRDALEKERRYG